MADGTFAVLLYIIGLTDMAYNYCGTETRCLGRVKTPARLAFSAGEWLDRRASPQGEFYVRYQFGHQFGPFNPTVGVSIAEGGETWVGVGQTYTHNFGRSPWYAQLHAMPGLYFDNGGFDLGGAVEFRSGIEIGYENRAGWRYGLSYDHRSNAGIYRDNPGVETVQFRVTIPLE